jgi:hypothetical protein
MTIRGSCLCGGVCFETRSVLSQAGYCHRSMCRKWSGSAFIAYAASRLDDFFWTEGESLIQRFRSSADFDRLACKVCGSSLAVWPVDSKDETIWIMLGALDDDPGAAPDKHIFVGSKARWHRIVDDLIQYDGFPTSPSSAG